MHKGIEKPNDEHIGKVIVELDEEPVIDGTIVTRMKSKVEGKETDFKMPRHNPSADWVEVFGLPPFNEFSGIPELKNTGNSFSSKKVDISEDFKVEDKGIHGKAINLKRSLGDLEENYDIKEMITPSNHRSLGIFDITHSNGETKMLIERNIVHTRPDIYWLKDSRLSKLQKSYLEDVIREEGLPDIVISKNCLVDGTTPAAYEKMFPFWEKKNYEDEKTQLLEIGYLDYGKNENDLDDVHGRWYKLFSFDDFDHPYLEVREGNWESTEVEIDGEKQNTLKHYEKYIYKY